MTPDNRTFSYMKKLKWVEKEFVVPAWVEFCKQHDEPLTLSEFDEFCYNLFTDESRVKALSYAASVDFVYHETRYSIILGYVDEHDKILACRPIFCKCKIK